MILPFEDVDSGFRIDFLFLFTPFGRQAIERARMIAVGGATVRFATPEDLIIPKMVAGRPCDEVDVRGILLKTRGIDVRYIEEWLGRFNPVVGRPVLERFQDLLESTATRTPQRQT
jgi:hypothetical protein